MIKSVNEGDFGLPQGRHGYEGASPKWGSVGSYVGVLTADCFEEGDCVTSFSTTKHKKFTKNECCS